VRREEVCKRGRASLSKVEGQTLIYNHVCLGYCSEAWSDQAAYQMQYRASVNDRSTCAISISCLEHWWFLAMPLSIVKLS